MSGMKAIVYSKYGPPEVLSVQEVAKPEPKEDEIQIRVRAAEATKSDCEMRSFKFAVKWFWLPLRIALGVSKPKNPILGGYFSGEVTGVGDGVSRFKIGDEVFGSSKLRMGAYGDYLCLPADYTIVAKPKNTTHEQAAAVPLGGFNALHYMRRGAIKPGDKVLINGAGGSIGTFAVQIAKAMGAQVTVVDSAIKEAMLRRIGADHFYDYERENFLNNGQRYDVIFNMVAGCSYSGFIGSLTSTGRYLLANPRLSDMVKSVLTTRFSQRTTIFVFAAETEEELSTLKDMIEADTIGVELDKIYPREQAVDAHYRVETEQRLGSVVISLL
jgi:NADPH:quinone reductase-like Zn-dependent oxidoreductase